MGEHCRVWDCNANAEWTSLGSTLSLIDVLNSHAWLFYQKVLFKCELIHKLNFRPNKQQPSRLLLKCGAMSGEENKILLPHKAAKKLIAMKIHHAWCRWGWKLGRGHFQQGFGLSSASSWLDCAHVASWSGTWAPVWLCAPSRAWLQEHGNPWEHMAPSLSQLGVPPGSWQWAPEPSCGREGWPEPGICSQELHGFSHGFIGTFGAVSAGQLLRHGAAGSQAALTNEAHGAIHVGHCSDLVWAGLALRRALYSPFSLISSFSILCLSHHTLPKGCRLSPDTTVLILAWFSPWCHIETDLTEMFL